MIGFWMLYAIAFSGLVMLAAALLERGALMIGRPTRFVWLLGMLASLMISFARMLPSSAPTVQQAAIVSAPQASHVEVGQMAKAGVTAATSSTTSVRVANDVLISFWFASVIVFICWFAVIAFRTRRVLARTRAGIIDGTPVRLSEAAGPALAGIFQYQIVVPRWVCDLEATEQSLIIRHEEEHAHARDPLLRIAGLLLVALMPWNVCLWFGFRRLERAVEVDCDRRVVGDTEDSKRYAELLVAVSGHYSRPALVPSLNNSSADLCHRLRALQIGRNRVSRINVLMLSSVAIIALTGAMRIPQPSAPKLHFGSTSRVDTAAVYSEWQVDKAVSLFEDVQPEYPAELRARMVSGGVVAQFIVDANGRVEKNSVRIQKTADPLFSEAVTAALYRARYVSAELRGKPVRQRVEQAFQFWLSPTISSRLTEPKRGAKAGKRRSVADSLDILARKLEPLAFDPKSPGSWVVGMELDANFSVIRHTRLSVADNQGNLRVLYPKLFTDAEKADSSPYQVMSLAEGVPGGKSVSIVSVFTGKPNYVR